MIFLQDECNDWAYASKVILAELTGDESIIDTPAPKREIAKPSTRDQSEWPDSGSARRRVKEILNEKFIFMKKLIFQQDDDETIGGENISFEAISRGGLTERRQLRRTRDDDAGSSTSPKSSKVGFDALRTIAQLQQQLA